MNNNQNSYLIAGSIVVAGALIGLGVFFAPTDSSAPAQTNNDNTPETAEINMRSVSADEHIRGDADAAVRIVEYSDLECPFCKRFHQTMNRIYQDYNDDQVAWVYRHFPLEQLHSKATAEAHATECAASLGGNEAFWNFTDKVFEVTPSNNGLDLDQLPEIAAEVGLDQTAFSDCQESNQFAEQVQEDLQDARNAGGTGTPHIVIDLEETPDEDVLEQLRALSAQSQGRIVVNEDGSRLAASGALPYEGMKQIIDLLLGETPPENTEG